MPNPFRLPGPRVLVLLVAWLTAAEAFAHSSFLVTNGGHQDLERDRIYLWLASRFDPDLARVDLDRGEAVDFQSARVVVYLSAASTPPSPQFRAALRRWLAGAADRRLVWLGDHGSTFPFRSWGFEVASSSVPAYPGDGSLYYKGAGYPTTPLVPFAFPQKQRFPATITDSRKATWEADYRGAGGDYHDAIVSGTATGGGKAYYFGFVPSTEMTERLGVHLVFMDLMHEVFPGFASTTKQMVLRFEDVSAYLDPETHVPSYQYAADALAYLASAGLDVPVVFATIPVYRNTRDGANIERHLAPLEASTASLADPGFKTALLRALSSSPGSTVVAHGYTHYCGDRPGLPACQSQETGLDREFYDRGSGTSLLTLDQTKAHADAAIGELESAGFADPVKLGSDRIMGFEVPHYDASLLQFAEAFEPRFGFLFEPAWWDGWLDLGGSPSNLAFMPYLLRYDRQQVLQTFHDYYHGAGDDVRILAEAALLSKLRYQVQSAFFFHPHVFKESGYPILANMVRTMRDTQGWTFPSLMSVVGHPWRKTGHDKAPAVAGLGTPVESKPSLGGQPPR